MLIALIIPFLTWLLSALYSYLERRYYERMLAAPEYEKMNQRFIKHVALFAEDGLGADFYLQEDIGKVVWYYDDPSMEQDFVVGNRCGQIALQLMQELGLYTPVTIGEIPALPHKLRRQWEQLFKEALAVNDRSNLQKGDFTITKTQGIGKILQERDGSALKIHLCTGYDYELKKVNLKEIRKLRGKPSELEELFDQSEKDAAKYLEH